MSSPEDILTEGCAILEPALLQHGFEYVPGVSAKGSGGRFARGRFVRGNRHLDLHVRRALGIVEYHVSEQSLSHEWYMLAATGRRGAYPGYSSDPIDGFRHLVTDLEAYGQVFLSGTDEQFAGLCERAKSADGKNET